ncbi:MAG TPA: hypothetical protein PKM21_07385 [Anaerolineales bacterium]|nr:hypothetical protein [Anaerolineales bacterium]
MYATLQDLFKTRLSVEHNYEGISFNTLVRVEAGLRLLEVLGLSQQPVLTVWALSQGLRVPALAGMDLNSVQKRWLACYRAVVHRSSKQDWQEDFGIYAQYPEDKRLYELLGEDETYDTVIATRTGRQSQREKIYDDVFGEPLPFRKEKRVYAQPGSYGFAYNREYKGELCLPERVIKEARKHPLPSFKNRPIRKEMGYSYSRLYELAQEMDELEHKQKLKRPGKWLDRVQRMIRFRSIQPNGELSDVNTTPILLSGMNHIAGMVGSGKSTIADIIAYDIARHQKGERVTLVVADVAEVMRLTEYFNNLLAKDGQPIAVPLLGPTMRDSHLINVFRQKDFSVAADRWKLRFLDTTCLVKQWLVNVDDTVNVKVAPGREPCNALYDVNDDAERKKLYLCPLFSICPVQQAYRDMISAPIWITTMGGLGQAKVPAQVDDRRIPLWVFIYENSTLVIFDEVDVVQSWFDKLLAPDLVLDDTGAGGLLQDTLRKIGAYPSGVFRENTDLDRWRQTYDLTMPALRNFLGLLERNDDLRNWLSVRPFTSLRILSELAARISGQFLWENEKAPSEVVELYDRLHALFAEIQRDDLSSLIPERLDPKSELVMLSSQITSYGRGEINPSTNKSVSKWINNRLAELSDSVRSEVAQRAKDYSLKHSKDDVDGGDPLDIGTLTRRLELGLVASVLDRELRGLFYGWHYVQELLGEEGMPSLIPTSLSGLLPSPPLGRWRGFRTSQDGNNVGKTLSLAILEYAEVGRYFVQNFDRILEDIEGRPGPNVLAMSGTSWMPDSARFHFAFPVSGILEPEESIQAAIRKSTITYLPQTTERVKGKPAGERYLRVSGAGKRMHENLERVVLALARKPDKFMSPLAREMDKLDALSKTDSDWKDRARALLIVNSYEQAEKVATILRGSLRSDLAEDVYAIVRSNDDMSEWEWRPYKPMKRSDVEELGHLARILVAPLGAVGRGYNIVSPITDKAAYGAIYFLIRPMTPPFDALTMVSGINHKLDNWLKPADPIWENCQPTILSQITRLRNEAQKSWLEMERGKFYRLMDPEEKKELGASTASMLIQACGRLVRGGVPFRAYFVDASWVNSPETEDGEIIASPATSLLAASIDRLLDYTTYDIGHALYGAFYDGFHEPQGMKLDLSRYT